MALSHEHEVYAVDNFFKRKLMEEQGITPLVEVESFDIRAAHWKRISGNGIVTIQGDITDRAFANSLMRDLRPDAIVHYGEQPSAPYSMIGQTQATATLLNNLVGTYNLIYAIKNYRPDCHLVKLGTLGEYGTPNIDIEEGYLDVTHNGREHTFLYPKTPGSMYHLSKVHDSDALYFACRTWGLRVTDLNQGFVYGIDTDDTILDDKLATRFTYDDIFGTVLNRFIVQAVIGHPLTVYGKGEQIRGTLNIRDTIQCVKLAVELPAETGEFRVFNQFTEEWKINDLADLVCRVAHDMEIEAGIEHLQNPRNELQEHYYHAAHTKLPELGLTPHKLTEDVIRGMLEYVVVHNQNINQQLIKPRVKWTTGL